MGCPSVCWVFRHGLCGRPRLRVGRKTGRRALRDTPSSLRGVRQGVRLIDASISRMNAQLTDTDRSHLKRALELAEGGRGRVSPNPLVGAVLVRDGEVIGEGFHAELGDLHAERAALEDCREPGRGSRRGDDVRDARALCPPGAAAALHRGDPRGGDRAGRDRLRRPDREGRRPRAGDPPRRRRRGRVRRRRGGDRRAAAQPALPQARPHRAAAGDAEDGDVARRPSRDRRPATRPGSPASAAASSSTAGAPNRTRSRSASAPSSPTTRCSPPARSSGARQPTRVVFDSPGPPAARLAAARGPSTRSPVLVVVSPEADAARALREAGAEVLVADGDPTTGALRRPRPPRHHQPLPRGRPDPGRRLRRRRARSTRRGSSSPRSCSARGSSSGGDGGRCGRRSSLERPLTPCQPAREAALYSRVETVGEDVLITARFKEW